MGHTNENALCFEDGRDLGDTGLSLLEETPALGLLDGDDLAGDERLLVYGGITANRGICKKIARSIFAKKED